MRLRSGVFQLIASAPYLQESLMLEFKISKAVRSWPHPSLPLSPSQSWKFSFPFRHKQLNFQRVVHFGQKWAQSLSQMLSLCSFQVKIALMTVKISWALMCINRLLSGNCVLIRTRSSIKYILSQKYYWESYLQFIPNPKRKVWWIIHTFIHMKFNESWMRTLN